MPCRLFRSLDPEAFEGQHSFNIQCTNENISTRFLNTKSKKIIANSGLPIMAFVHLAFYLKVHNLVAFNSWIY